MSDMKLKELAEHLGAEAAYYARRTGVIGGDGFVEHLQVAAAQFLRRPNTAEDEE